MYMIYNVIGLNIQLNKGIGQVMVHVHVTEYLLHDSQLYTNEWTTLRKFGVLTAVYVLGYSDRSSAIRTSYHCDSCLRIASCGTTGLL